MKPSNDSFVEQIKSGAEADERWREEISALIDGELEAARVAKLTTACAQDLALRSAWDDYHRIGDALRSQSPAPSAADARFVAGVMQAIENLAKPERAPGAVPVPSLAPPVIKVRQPTETSANDNVFRWRVAAGVAAFAAITSLAWQLTDGLKTSAGPQYAVGPADAALGQVQTMPQAQIVQTSAGTVIRDPRLEEMLNAHRQFGGVSALQMPAGFLRNATYETP